METFTFTANDPRLGTYNPDGSYQTWPATDVFGKPYEHVNATVRRVSATQFIVIGPDGEKDIEGFTFERPSVSAKPKTEG